MPVSDFAAFLESGYVHPSIQPSSSQIFKREVTKNCMRDTERSNNLLPSLRNILFFNKLVYKIAVLIEKFQRF